MLLQKPSPDPQWGSRCIPSLDCAPYTCDLTFKLSTMCCDEFEFSEWGRESGVLHGCMQAAQYFYLVDYRLTLIATHLTEEKQWHLHFCFLAFSSGPLFSWIGQKEHFCIPHCVRSYDCCNINQMQGCIPLWNQTPMSSTVSILCQCL